MKRLGNVYHKICDLDNIKQAILQASKRKRKHRAVRRVLADIDGHAKIVQDLLLSKTYRPSPGRIRDIKDPATGKIRTINCPKFFPDQVIHWALMNHTRDVLLRGSYEHSAGGIPGRGAHKLARSVTKWVKRDRKNTKYFLKMDIRKFYQSIDGKILKKQLRRVLKDPDALWLFDVIIDSSDGLPIGYVTSVYLSDFHLQQIDHIIKEVLGIKYYARYVDDMVLFSTNKKTLHKTKKIIEKLLERYGLTVKDNWQISPLSSRDIDFLGYRINRNRVFIRKRTALRMRRRIRRVAKQPLNYQNAAAIISYWGIIQACNSFNFRKKCLEPYINIETVKGMISVWQKSNQI